MASEQRKRPMSEINVVPYIDVMLVLLVIFMITAPLLTQGVKIDLPNAPAAVVEATESEPLIVSVDSEGRYFINFGGMRPKRSTRRPCSIVPPPFCGTGRTSRCSSRATSRSRTGPWWSRWRFSRKRGPRRWAC